MADDLDLRGKGRASDWLESLVAHDVRYLILDVRSDAELLRRVDRQPGWHLDVNDGYSAIYMRDVAEAPPRSGGS
jgi:hypothetical protein